MVKKLVIVLGSPAAGKTTLVGKLEKDKKYKLINLGDVMLEIGKKRKMVKNRDQLRYLSNDETTDLRTMAVEYVAKIDGKVVLDTHATVEQHGRYFPGLPHYMMNHLRHVTGLFYIDASTEELLGRRREGRGRHEELEEDWIVDTQRDVNLAILSYYATDLNIPLYIIHNKNGQLDKAVAEFKEHLKDAFGEK